MARENDYYTIMSGLEELDIQGQSVPSDLVLIGDHAFPLAMNPRGQVLMAASRYGQGRVVVLGHESYLTRFPGLIENALMWLMPCTGDAGIVGIQKSLVPVADNLCFSPVSAELCDFREGLAIYVTDAYSVEACAKDLIAFVKAGGGLIIAGQACSWAEAHPQANVFLNFPGNKVCSVSGIYFSEHRGELGVFPVPPNIPSSWLAASIRKDFKDDLACLLKGVPEFDIQGGSVASELMVHGPLAFPIAVTPCGKPFIAGAYYGQGRVIVMTHEGFLGRESLSTFLINAIHWLDEGRKGVIGIPSSLGGAHTVLSKSGLNCQFTNFKEDLSVYVCTSYSDAQCQQIQDFVAEGSGLLIGGHAWHWAHTHPSQNVMTEYPGNHILNQMGLCILGSYVSGGLYKAPELENSSKEVYHFRNILHQFGEHVTKGHNLSPQVEGYLRQLGNDCSSYLKMCAHDCASYNSVITLLTDMVKEAGVPQVCNNCPVQSPRDHLMLKVGSELYKVSPDPDALLPYIIKNRPDMPTLSNAKIPINVDTVYEEWISTGLYLSPGMRTYMAVPPELIGKNWQVQIGCQTDNLGAADVLKRPCVVHERYPLDKEMVQVCNLWGGLIYLVAPPKSKVDGVEIVVQTSIQAPYFKSGETSVADWVGGIRHASAPWAELEFENIIITLESSIIRNLDRPDEVAALWDSIMRSVADLAAKPPKLPRKERYVADVQISHGFMHAGYPVMMHSGSASGLVNTEVARKGLWGAIHELGHNQQCGVWEFPPHTTECTCNLWSVYVHEEVLGVQRANAHPAMTPENRQERARGYAKGGRDLKNWSMWVALETYMQLQEKFGWDAFKKVFAAYQTMSGVPKDNAGKMNLYAETFSKTVNMNLSSFFKAWGWPIQPSTEEKIAQLPDWSDHPMKQYD
ncbi:TRPM8 channel-associated factor -like protein [Triplophysa tibetana]|uniref:TRPM8 channel-associated factor-like protein n=1 Tax=Triplophysa tibetana TaxID=1572043 RepID=A0A5A9MYH0_9TELE|nr:TRPM8 channel-associated factor -like protein [Triplophysa tibetana]